MKKKASVALVLALMVVGLVYWFVHTRTKDLDGRALDAIYSQSMSDIQEICCNNTKRWAGTWLPAVSSYLQKNYGPVTSRKLVSSVDYGPTRETVWQITAEHGSFDMRTLMRARDGQLAIIEFRFPPSNEWTAVHMVAISLGQFPTRLRRVSPERAEDVSHG